MVTKSLRLMLGLVASLMLASGALAGERAMSGFEALDADKDGQLTAKEASAHQGLTKNWKTVDTDASGTIDPAEFSAFETAPQSMKK